MARAKTAKPKKAAKGNVRVRMYRQGLGDCFLLSFPGAKGDVHVLIDCGVILGTKDPVPKMQQVVKDITAATRGRIDLLVGTHEHWDHLSGFVQAREEFDKLKVGAVWLAWTEDPHDDEARRLRADRKQKLAALRMGLAQLGARLGATDDDDPTKKLADQAIEVLSFFGPDEDAAAGGLGAAAGPGKTIGDAMDWLQQKKPHYCRPGDVLPLPGVDKVRVYVLGPPTDLAKLHKLLPTRSGNETYGVALRATDYDGAFFGALFPPPAAGAADDRTDEQRAAHDQSMPFGSCYRIAEGDARHDPFFQSYYGAPGNDPEGWRRIDSEWLSGAAELALQLDSYTNNTSLALAFELPDGRVLLFPGDAQVGNWLSWHDMTWKDGKEPLKVTAQDLLNRTVLYKVGHHGSHNATLREKGLEMMISPGLVAMLPVDEKVAHGVKHWLQMPFKPLLEQLGKRSGNHILWADRQPDAAPKKKGGKAGAKADEVMTRVEFSKEPLVGTDDRSLYVEYTLPP
jgi:glyoxylase-like metal-dependent hydrolase (beta-lactamase superfamily II)